MQSWLQSLLDPRFMPHGHCYLWKPEILWTHVISDAVVTIAYYAIPVVLAVFLLKRRQTLPYPELVALFVAFIFLCGTTHLIAIYVTWYPAYELQGWVKAATALVSIYTALALAPKLPELLELTGIKHAYDESQTALEELKQQNEQMQSVYESAMNREEKILALKSEVNALLEQQGQSARYLLDHGGQ